MAGPFTGDVSFTILDGSASLVTVPSARVQCVIGCANSGTNYQVVPAATPATIQSTFVGGPLMEACGLTLLAGGVVLAVKVPATTVGVLNGAGAVGGGVSTTTGNGVTPIVVTTTSAHGLITGAVVTIASVTGNTAANGTFIATVTGASTFSVPATGNGAYISGGTVTATGCVVGGSGTGATFQGTAVPTITGTPNDDYYPMVVCQKAITVATGGSVIVSLDGGRNFGAPINVGTGTTLALKDVGGLDTGLTLNLGTSSMTWTGGGMSNGAPVGDFIRSSTTGPYGSDANIDTAMAAVLTYLAGSQAAFPLFHILGVWGAADATAFDTGNSHGLSQFASQYLFERALINVRDAKSPTAWGGVGESEATWLSSINSAFSATTCKRVTACAGHYNMPSAFPTQFAGTPRYRRPFSFALAARQVAIQPQTHAGRVAGAFGGAISQIVRDPVNDPNDGFIYHDEYLTPSLDYLLPGGVGRFGTARTHARKQGFFASNPLTLNASGSDYTLLPRALVIDVACTLTYNAMIQFQNADLVLRANGTLSDGAANTIRGAINDQLNQGMVAQKMISGFNVTIDQTQNILISNTIVATVTILGVGYALQQQVTIGYTNSLATQATG